MEDWTFIFAPVFTTPRPSLVPKCCSQQLFQAFSSYLFPTHAARPRYQSLIRYRISPHTLALLDLPSPILHRSTHDQIEHKILRQIRPEVARWPLDSRNDGRVASRQGAPRASPPPVLTFSGLRAWKRPTEIEPRALIGLMALG